jgi:hypothetical protein
VFDSLEKKRKIENKNKYCVISMKVAYLSNCCIFFYFFFFFKMKTKQKKRKQEQKKIKYLLIFVFLIFLSSIFQNKIKIKKNASVRLNSSFFIHIFIKSKPKYNKTMAKGRESERKKKIIRDARSSDCICVLFLNPKNSLSLNIYIYI